MLPSFWARSSTEFKIVTNFSYYWARRTIHPQLLEDSEKDAKEKEEALKRGEKVKAVEEGEEKVDEPIEEKEDENKMLIEEKKEDKSDKGPKKEVL